MTKRVIRNIVIFLLVTTVGIIAINYYKQNFEQPGLCNKKANFVYDAPVFYSEYVADEKAGDEKFLNKIIEIDGDISEILYLKDKTIAIMLKNGGEEPGIINCSLDKSENKKAKKLQENDKITIKGLCSGMLREITDDIMLNKCLIIE